MFTKVWATAIFLIICSCAYSQDYMIRSTLPVDDTKAFVSLQYGRKQYGCGFINARGVMEAQIPIEGFPFGLAKSGTKNVILFYEEETKNTSPTKVVHAVLIEAGKKRIIKDNIFYNNPGRNDIDLKVICDPAGNFITLLVRITDYSPQMGGFGGNAELKRKKTTAMVSVTTDNNLAPKETKLTTSALDGEFIAACGGTNGNLFISSLLDGQVIAERFDSLGTFKNKLTAELSIKRKSRMQELFKYDSLGNNCVNLAVTYIDEQKSDYLQLFRFDFMAMKKISTEKIVLNKDYVRSLKNGNDNVSNKNFGEIYNLKPVQLLETNDKIILVKEIQSETFDKNSVTQNRYGSIISIYSKDLKLLHETSIDKWCAFNIFSFPATWVYLKGDKLYIVTDEMKGAVSYRAILSNMNINTGTIVRSGEIEKEESGFNWITVPGDIMWFSNSFVVPFTNAKSFIKLSLETSLVTEKYK